MLAEHHAASGRRNTKYFAARLDSGHTHVSVACLTVLMHTPRSGPLRPFRKVCWGSTMQLPIRGSQNILPVSSLCHSPPPTSWPLALITDMGQCTCKRAIARRRRHPLCHSCFSRSFRLLQSASLVTPLLSSARSYTSHMHVLPRLAALDAQCTLRRHEMAADLKIFCLF